MRLGVAGLVGAVTLVVFALGLPPPALSSKLAGAAQPVGAARDINDLLSRITTILQRNDVPGAGIAIASRNGIIWTGGLGLADVQTGRPVTASTPFRLGSVTKNVTALAVMQQVERGRLSLDAKLHDVAPEVPFTNPWEDTHPVHIANLLEHTAGFDFVRFNDDADYGPPGRPLLSALEVNPEARVARWQPGTRMAYSNEGFTSAGYVLEKVTGRSIDGLVNDGIFMPLGMQNSALRWTPELARTLAQGYGPGGRAEVYVEDMQVPAANLIASSDDMARYLQMWLGRGELNGRSIVSAESIARMETRGTLPYAGPEDQYGLGTDTAQYDGFVGHGHTGVATGFSASFRYFPREGVGWVVMLNALPSQQALPQIEDELLGFVMQGSSPPAPTGAPAVDLGLFTGYYRDAAPTQQFLAVLTDTFGGTEIQLRSDGLWERTYVVGGLKSLAIPSDPWRKLNPVDAQGSFRHDDETVSTRYFTRTEAGVPVLVTPMGYFEQSSKWVADLKRILLLGSLGLLASGLLLVAVAFAQAFGLRAIGVLGGLPPTLELLPPVLLVLIAGACWALLSRSPERQSEVNVTTVALFAASTLFPLVAAWNIGTAVRASFAIDVGVVFKAYLLVNAAAGVALSVFAWSAHWVALRTWAW